MSVAVPFMSLYNNLVMSTSTWRNSLARSCPTSPPTGRGRQHTKLVFTVREGVSGTTASRSAPRTSPAPSTCCWAARAKQAPAQSAVVVVDQYREGDADSDTQATFHLKAPQPSLLALLASGYTPIYPCHIPPDQMRRRPVGAGRFAFAEFKMNEGIKLTRNPDYWKKSSPISTSSSSPSCPIAARACWRSSPASST